MTANGFLALSAAAAMLTLSACASPEPLVSPSEAYPPTSAPRVSRPAPPPPPVAPQTSLPRQGAAAAAVKSTKHQYLDQRSGRYYYFDQTAHRYYWEDGTPRY